MIDSQFRGHHIIEVDGEWFYESGALVSENWLTRGCGYCGKADSPEGHDACLGTLPLLMNACCGHGVVRDTYVQFRNGATIQGRIAILCQKFLITTTEGK